MASWIGGHLKGPVLYGAFYQAATDCLDGHAHPFNLAVDLDLDALQVGLELAAGLAGDLAADAAQVLRLAAPRIFIAQNRLLAGDGTFHSHNHVFLMGLRDSPKQRL